MRFKEEKRRLRNIGMPEPWNIERALDQQWLQSIAPKEVPLVEVSVSCAVARIPFDFEYIGNQERLAITPLTDKCYRTVFMALHYCYGSSIEGPVGTGKTETAKELSKSLGKMCFVFNCSNSLNFDSLLKFFKGFACGGSWSCFDEFNRIEIDVLSVIS